MYFIVLKQAFQNIIFRIIQTIFNQYQNFMNYVIIAKLEFKNDILKSILYIFFIFYFFFSIYIKISKNSSAKYYQEDIEILQKDFILRLCHNI